MGICHLCLSGYEDGDFWCFFSILCKSLFALSAKTLRVACVILLNLLLAANADIR